MADKKVSQLTALTGANTASGDLLYIVDVSEPVAADQSKKITLTEFQSAPISAGTANGVAFLNASKVLTTGSALTFDGTNFCVGTASSSGGYRFTQLVPASGSPVSAFRVTNGSDATFDVNLQTSLASIGTGVGDLAFLRQGSEQMRLTSTGLGIGTSSPTNKLTVDGNANITGNTTLGDASTDAVTVNGYLGVGGAANSVVSAYVRGTHSGSAADIYANRVTQTIPATATGSWSAFSNINSTTAASAFTASFISGLVLNNVSAGAGSTITDQHGINISNLTSGTNNYGITCAVSSGSNKWNIYASGTAANYFAGDVGIGTSSPVFALDVVSASKGIIRVRGGSGTNEGGAFFVRDAANTTTLAAFGDRARIFGGTPDQSVSIYTSSGDPLIFDVGASERARIDSSGNLGIGTSSPVAKLDVAGNVFPTTTNTHNLGAGDKRWNNVHANIITADLIYASNIANVGSFTWNTATSSPAAIISRGSQVITPIHTGMRRCVINDSGVVQYYLSATDSTKKADGTNATITGGDGQVMVEIPAFYTRREVSGTYITWSISPVPLPGFTLHPAFTKDGVDVSFRYIGAYDACVYDVSTSTYISGLNHNNNISPNGVAVDSAADKLASVSGIFPMVGLTRAENRTIAANRGTGWRQLDYTLFSAVQLLYLIEYQTFFSQNVLGAGNTGTTYAASSGTQSDNGGSEAGKSNSIGNASTNTTNGASSGSRGVAWMSYRGIENFYGNEWKWVDGVIVNAAGSVGANAAVWDFTNNSADFSDTVNTNMTQIITNGVTTSNFASVIASVDNFFIATSVSGGSSSTYTTDYFWSDTSADRVGLVSGDAQNGAHSGVFLVAADVGSSDRDRRYGARLAF